MFYINDIEIRLTCHCCRYASQTGCWWSATGKTAAGAELHQRHHLLQVGQTGSEWGIMLAFLFLSIDSAFAVISLALHSCPAAALPTRWWTSSTSSTPHLTTSSTTMMSTRWKPSGTPVSHSHTQTFDWTLRGKHFSLQKIEPCEYGKGRTRWSWMSYALFV